LLPILVAYIDQQNQPITWKSVIAVLFFFCNKFLLSLGVASTMKMSPVTLLEEFCKELGRREEAIRAAYKQARIQLDENSPLAKALAEAKELADGVKSKESANDQSIHRTVEAAHVVYALAESIETCRSGGLDITRHLAQMATGTINFGTPGTSEKKDIYLKDFEYELFIASTLLNNGLRPNFLDDPSDPIGEMEVNGLIVECKHPNAESKLMRNITKFGKKLLEADRYGIFAAGIEDAYRLGDVEVFADMQAYSDWLEPKRDAMETSGRRRAAQVSGHERILALIHTQTKLLIIDGQTSLSRLGNAMLFDNNENFPSHEADVTSVARAFIPSPLRYSML
jgi:hypothetical protein